jgi:hypothetical protein
MMTTPAASALESKYVHQHILYDYATSEPLRSATPSEVAACALASESDATGIGAFEVDGRLCFVV